MVPGVNQRKGHRRWPLMDLCLECVGVEDLMGSDILMICGTSENASQESTLWQGCIFQMMLRVALSTINMESQTFDEAICDSSYKV